MPVQVALADGRVIIVRIDEVVMGLACQELLPEQREANDAMLCASLESRE